MSYQYLRNPEEIYRQSFTMIDELIDVSPFAANNAEVIKRMVHACGIPDIVKQIHCHPEFANSATQSLNAGCHVMADCEMALAGIMQHRAAPQIKFNCTLNDPRTAQLAQSLMTTRSAAAVELWMDKLDQAVVVIGNAPTALFHLLELLDQHPQRPAAIIGLPVGFVGASESKQALVEAHFNIPYLTLSGRMGGSAMASAAFNALLLQI